MKNIFFKEKTLFEKNIFESLLAYQSAEMITVIFDTVLYFYFAVVLVAAILGFTYRRFLPYPINWLYLYLGLDIFIELLVFILRQFKEPFVWAYNLFGPVEYFFITWLYFTYFKKTSERVTLVSLYVLYTLFTIYSMLFMQHYFEYNLIFLGRSMLMATLVLYYFLMLYQRDDILNINKSPLFWISIGLFFFCTGSIFSMGLGIHAMRLNITLGYIIYLLNPVLNIYLYVMFIVGFICSKRNPGYY